MLPQNVHIVGIDFRFTHPQEQNIPDNRLFLLVSLDAISVMDLTLLWRQHIGPFEPVDGHLIQSAILSVGILISTTPFPPSQELQQILILTSLVF